MNHYILYSNSNHLNNIYDSDKVLVLSQDGKVGIGASKPTKALDISGGILTFTGSNPTKPTEQGVYIYNGYNVGPTISGHKFKVMVNNGNVDAMFIEHNGDVGIGTDNPSSKLDVNGAIKCHKSNSKWCTNNSKLYSKQ